MTARPTLYDKQTGETMPLPADLTAVSLHLPAGLTFDDWAAYGQGLNRMGKAVMWWIGDWWAYGTHRWGDRARTVLDADDGYAWQTCKDAGWVSRKFGERSRRRDLLPWSFHKEVAGIDDPDVADQLLDDATNEGWTQARLRQAVKQSRRERATASITAKAADTAIPAQVQAGEWWQLGPHLLYCGDSASADFTSRIGQAAFAFADPPYNAKAASWDSGFTWQHDYLSGIAPLVAVTPGISAIADFFTATAMPYRWSMAAWITNGMTRGALGFGNWIYVALFAEATSIHRNAQDHLRISINPTETGDTDHKGRKPSQLLVHLLDLFTSAGDLVVDPFLGSGTTLFAAEATGRRCIAAELSPDFCTKVVARYPGSVTRCG